MAARSYSVKLQSYKYLQKTLFDEIWVSVKEFLEKSHSLGKNGNKMLCSHTTEVQTDTLWLSFMWSMAIWYLVCGLNSQDSPFRVSVMMTSFAFASPLNNSAANQGIVIHTFTWKTEEANLIRMPEHIKTQSKGCKLRVRYIRIYQNGRDYWMLF